MCYEFDLQMLMARLRAFNQRFKESICMKFSKLRQCPRFLFIKILCWNYIMPKLCTENCVFCAHLLEYLLFLPNEDSLYGCDDSQYVSSWGCFNIWGFQLSLNSEELWQSRIISDSKLLWLNVMFYLDSISLLHKVEFNENKINKWSLYVCNRITRHSLNLKCVLS